MWSFIRSFHPHGAGTALFSRSNMIFSSKSSAAGAGIVCGGSMSFTVSFLYPHIYGASRSWIRLLSTDSHKIRNCAIIAHVDHGKTSLVDQLLRQSGTLKEMVSERVMDSNQLEKERGITILAKCTSIKWRDTHINIVDTPGHGDFGGEVERVLSTVDGVVLLVDVNEGPMAQTKYVLSKALKSGLKPLVVINKMDRPDSISKADSVETQLFDLFTSLDATDEQLSYPTLYASAREGWAVKQRDDLKEGMTPLLDSIIHHIPPPQVDINAPFSMLVCMLESDGFLGRLVLGKVRSGQVRAGMTMNVLSREGQLVETAKVFKVVARRGLERVIVEEGVAGDIVGLAGFTHATATMTVCAQECTTPIPATPIDPPVISMLFCVNKSPFAGREGTHVTSVKLRQRLEKEAESNVSLSVAPTNSEDAYEVKGRGEMQLGILLEEMRREGYEVAVSQPRILMQRSEEGELLEPIEELTLDVDLEYSGWAIERMSRRKADMIDMKTNGDKCRLAFRVPARGLLGFRAEFLNETHGTGVMNHLFHSYAPYKGPLDMSRKGALISSADGVATAYALEQLQARGTLFISPQAKVYTGMIIGEHSRDDDLDVNPVKTKHLTNVRTVMKEDQVRLTPPLVLTLELALSSVKEDELIEVTPQSICIRKKELDLSRRRTMARKGQTIDMFVDS